VVNLMSLPGIAGQEMITALTLSNDVLNDKLEKAREHSRTLLEQSDNQLKEIVDLEVN
jgi:hypothetical protein